MNERRQPLVYGDVWLADPSPDLIGHEQMHRRPVVIVSATSYNEDGDMVIVIPLTSRGRMTDLRVRIQSPEGGLRQASWALPDQIRATDRMRLVERWGALSSHTLDTLKDRLRALLDL